MKVVFAVIVTFCMLSQAFAQQPELPQSLSLAEARQIALSHNPDLQVSILNTQIARKQVEQAKREKIPAVYANYDLRRNLIIPVTPVPAKAFDPNAPEGELLPLKFSTNWSSNAGLNATVDLFNPQKHGQLKVTQQQVALQDITRQITTSQLKFKIGKDYAACVIARKQLKLAVADTLSKNKILNRTKERYAAGRLSISDLNEIQAAKNTALSNYFNAVKIQASARARLLADMGYDPAKTYKLSLTDSIQSLLAQLNKQPDEHTNSLSLQKWKQQKRLTAIQLANTRAGFLPVISIKGFYGANYFDNNFNLFNADHWYGNSYIGLSVNLPVTADLARIKKIEALRLQQKADLAGYRAQHLHVQLAIVQAEADITYKKKVLQQKEKNIQMARENLRAATDLFSNGRLLVGDLVQANYLYQQAKTAYLQAVYDLIIARMTLRKVSRE